MGANLAAAPGSYGQRVAFGERFAQKRDALTAIRRPSGKNPQEKVAMIQRDIAEPSQNVRQRRPFGPKSGPSGRETDFSPSRRLEKHPTSGRYSNTSPQSAGTRRTCTQAHPHVRCSVKQNTLDRKKKRASRARDANENGGGGGIRTLVRGVPVNGFRDRRIQPLCHSSVKK